jgi:hypothetical protein
MFCAAAAKKNCSRTNFMRRKRKRRSPMKKLGDGAIHPNDGDVTAQVVLDGELIARLAHTFQMLLFMIYELPHEKQKRLDGLKAGIIMK